MIYEYFCETCKLAKEVVKPVSEASLPEFCIVCNNTMIRIYSVPQVHVKNHGYYNHGLDKYITTKQDIIDAQNEYKDTHDSELIELGNETLKHLKPKKHSYDFTPEEKVMVDKLMGAN